MRTYTRNSDSAYDSLSRCSLDSLSGYIDDDYANNLLGDTKINVDKVNGSEQEIKNLKSRIGQLTTTVQELQKENAILYKNNKVLRAKENRNKIKVNDLSDSCKRLEFNNVFRGAEIDKLMQQNLYLEQKVLILQAQEPKVITKYIELQPKPRWQVEFEDVEGELTEKEQKFVLNTIPSKSAREWITKAVHRRRNGDYMTWAEKNARTQRYIRKLQAEYDEEMSKKEYELNELQSQLLERDSTISNLYQELEYQECNQEENNDSYLQKVEDMKKELNLKDDKLKQLSEDMIVFKDLYEQLLESKESHNSTPDPAKCANKCKSTIETLQKQIHEKDMDLISAREDFKEARKQNYDLKLSHKELVETYEEKLAAYANESENETVSGKDDTEPDDSHWYKKGNQKATIHIEGRKDTKDLPVIYESNLGYESEERSESDSEENYEWDSEEEESELFDREETSEEKDLRLQILTNIIKNRQMTESKLKHPQLATEFKLGSLFCVDNELQNLS